MVESRTTQARVERIRSKMSELSVMHRGQSLAVTVSVGVAELAQRGTSPKNFWRLPMLPLRREEKRPRPGVLGRRHLWDTEVKCT